MPEEERARAAYEAMWAAYVAASRTADYRSPALARYAAGAALSVLTRGLYSDFRNGIVTRGHPSFNPSITIITAADGREADVTDCADSTHWTDYTRSGTPVSGQQQGRRRIAARLQPFAQAGGTVWKVTYLNVGQAGSC